MSEATLFKKLHDLAVSVDRERDVLLEKVSQPTELSSPSDHSGLLALKNIHKDVRQLKIAANRELCSLRESTQLQISNLDASKRLLLTQLDQLNTIEDHLKQYGYVPYQPPAKDASGEDKNNVPVVECIADRDDLEQHEDTVSEGCITFPGQDNEHDQQKAHNRTPNLADFGVSQKMLSAIANINSRHIQHGQHGHNATGILDSTDIPATPYQSVPKICFDSPCPPVIKTPGVKQVHKPGSHIDRAQFNIPYAVNSPIPPVLKTPGLKQMPRKDKIDYMDESLGVMKLEDTLLDIEDETIQFETTSTTQVTGETTGVSNDVNTKYDPAFPRTIDCTPEPPNMLTTQLQYTLPAPPIAITNKHCDQTTPEPPTIKTEQLNDQSEPVYSSLSCVPADLTYSLFAGDKSTDSLLSAKNQTVTKLQIKQEIQEMPMTPELTGRYNFTATALPTAMETLSGITNFNDTSKENIVSMDHITEEEYQRQADFLKRQLSLEFINVTVNKINEVIHQKRKDGQKGCVSQCDLDLGVKTKAMLLFLVKLQRLKTYGKDENGNTTYELL